MLHVHWPRDLQRSGFRRRGHPVAVHRIRGFATFGRFTIIWSWNQMELTKEFSESCSESISYNKWFRCTADNPIHQHLSASVDNPIGRRYRGQWVSEELEDDCGTNQSKPTRDAPCLVKYPSRKLGLACCQLIGSARDSSVSPLMLENKTDISRILKWSNISLLLLFISQTPPK